MTQLFFGHLSRFEGLAHTVTTRHGGISQPPFDALNLARHVGDDETLVRANRQLVAKSLLANASELVFMNQIHSNRCLSVHSVPSEPPPCDALISATPGLTLAVMVADCIPLLFFDPEKRVVGVAHAGWKGTLGQIAAQTVERMAREFGSRPESVLAGIGPGIGGLCYEVDEKVAHPWLETLPERFHAPLRKTAKGRWHLDLQQANRMMLIDAGLKAENIETMALCTHCEPALFSYRREGTTGRFAGLIGLR